MKSKVFKKNVALLGAVVVFLILCLFFEKLSSRFQLPECLLKGEPLIVSNKDKIESSDENDFLAKIKPAENIGDYYQAFSESILVVKSYESLKRSNHVKTSELVTYRKKLLEAYAVFLALHEDENEDGKKVVARELNHCGKLITSITQELATGRTGEKD
jgi:hypothetical protein